MSLYEAEIMFRGGNAFAGHSAAPGRNAVGQRTRVNIKDSPRIHDELSR